MTEAATLITVLYALVGACGAISIVVFAWGFAEYITKIGLPAAQRDKGIEIMEWGVRFSITTVFVILVLKIVERWLA